MLGFTNLTTQYTLPPGVAETVEYNLAAILATPYGRPLPADVDKRASRTLAWVKTGNTKLVDAMIDPALTQEARRPWNILAGQ